MKLIGYIILVFIMWQVFKKISIQNLEYKFKVAETDAKIAEQINKQREYELKTIISVDKHQERSQLASDEIHHTKVIWELDEDRKEADIINIYINNKLLNEKLEQSILETKNSLFDYELKRKSIGSGDDKNTEQSETR